MDIKVVLLPITVPNSIFCYHKELGYRCLAFGPFCGCCYNFKPIKISEDIFEKDQECKNLLCKEVIE